MEDILNIVIESDEKARKITKKAEEEKAAKEKEILSEREKIYNEYIELAKARIDKDIEKTKVRESDKLEETVKEHDILRKKMEKHFAENRAQWADEIFSSVIKA